ncbi:TadE/TadG family type IV pilus assembly protein [Ruegeria atlantica]|uniref:Flp pilus assembly protein TadG n=1 Tax=Ruegeria atlantica TaxID=81569 RepID=A0A0P1E7E1_9RHOB|nr:TadE/TadG family type IV pilus assembly protein [Ruegeria atlantica]CUH44855.1 Flp pilus assembly protein TadG [Ruegeria atlantica]
MIRKALGKAVQFKRTEDGSLTVEFAIWFPLYMFFILGVIEYSLVSIQKAMLDRSMDLVVRDIRLGINLPDAQHNTIKGAICDKMVVMQGCSENLQLEMIVQDPYGGVNLPLVPDCTDRAEEAKPVREFSNGGSNALMILRACAKFDPLFPTTAMGRAVSGDDGLVTLTATTTFVQEP